MSLGDSVPDPLESFCLGLSFDGALQSLFFTYMRDKLSFAYRWKEAYVVHWALFFFKIRHYPVWDYSSLSDVAVVGLVILRHYTQLAVWARCIPQVSNANP